MNLLRDLYLGIMILTDGVMYVLLGHILQIYIYIFHLFIYSFIYLFVFIHLFID